MIKSKTIFFAILPTTTHLFFKCCKKLAMTKWQLVLPDDQLLVEPAKRETIPKSGSIMLVRSPRRIEEWFSAPPFQTAYHDGRRYYIIFPREEFWERLEIQPFKAERDAWLAQRKEPALKQEARGESEVAPNPAPQPHVKPTITFKVTPRTENTERLP